MFLKVLFAKIYINKKNKAFKELKSIMMYGRKYIWIEIYKKAALLLSLPSNIKEAQTSVMFILC